MEKAALIVLHNFKWLLNHGFIIRYYKAMPEVIIFYESESLPFRISISVLQREPFMVFLASKINNVWYGDLLGHHLTQSGIELSNYIENTNYSNTEELKTLVKNSSNYLKYLIGHPTYINQFYAEEYYFEIVKRKAELAVSDRDKRHIQSAIEVLSRSDLNYDFKLSLQAIAIINHSMQLLKLNPEVEFKRDFENFSIDFNAFVNQFLNRTEKDKNLKAMGYKTQNKPVFKYIHIA